MPRLNAAQLQQLALLVRREAVEHFGFVEPQASVLDLMCGDLSWRLYEKIRTAQGECSVGVLKFCEGPYHDVVVCGDWLVDASITQFYVEKWKHLTRFAAPLGQFVFEVPGIEALLPYDKLAPMALPQYPLGEISGAGRLKDTRSELNYYGQRAYLVQTYPSRFSAEAPSDDAALLWRMAEAPDPEWRAAAAASIRNCNAEDGRRLFELLQRDDSRLVIEVLAAALKAWWEKELAVEFIEKLSGRAGGIQSCSECYRQSLHFFITGSLFFHHFFRR